MGAACTLVCRDCRTPADREAALRIRFVVFVDEQNVPAEIETDVFDRDALHLLAVNVCPLGTEEPVGTARVVDKGHGVVKIGRVAVLREWRGRGVGAALMRYALNAVRAAGATTAVLDVQLPVIPFYEKLGFAVEGPVFDDAGIPHRRMTRPL
jgi:ElaA protein